MGCRGAEPGSRLSYPARAPGFSSKSLSRLSIAQAIRASLLASATRAMLRCVLASRPRNQAPSGVMLLARVGIAALAPWMNSIRGYLFAALADAEQLRLAACGVLL